ncbi:hypothetical protein [Stutzerimonas stutzeri]|uniref:hypothetical protein n=1 Tax=Stutzerimonas stutzeri TaxID=316 RepID=UPI00210E29B8|nr:hypothetical protein [Stutzerimonas stutzeri]MCQ4323225.1 hypothetical protein [Stutzerimonas stutzeri]
MLLKTFTVASLILTLTGCSSTTTLWTHPENDYNITTRDEASCAMAAESGTPIYIPKQQSNTTHHTGTVQTNQGNYQYSGTSYNTNNNIDLSGASYLIKRNSIFENCMVSKGYSKQIIENSQFDGSKIRNCKLPNGMEFKTTIQACKSSNGTTSGLW